MTITFNTRVGAGAPASPARVINSWLDAGGRAWSNLRERRRARANFRALGTVSNATLRDIGLHRSEILSMTMGDASGRRRSMGCR
jgi:uncharacterized protein YjiS (DUF1127 family)